MKRISFAHSYYTMSSTSLCTSRLLSGSFTMPLITPGKYSQKFYRFSYYYRTLIELSVILKCLSLAAILNILKALLKCKEVIIYDTSMSSFVQYKIQDKKYTEDFYLCQIKSLLLHPVTAKQQAVKRSSQRSPFMFFHCVPFFAILPCQYSLYQLLLSSMCFDIHLAISQAASLCSTASCYFSVLVVFFLKCSALTWNDFQFSFTYFC